tara:strand:- start:382 stop:660 length:279 start_codon:yes stop_codon:yes gene_type:complete
MNKYLTFAIEDFPPAMVAINGGLTVGTITSTEVKLHSADNALTYSVVGTGFTVAMEKAVNAALVIAAQTNWMKVVHPVDLPAGEVVTSITIA